MSITPAVEMFVLCEDIREEANGLPSLMGVYPANSVALLADNPDSVESLPQLAMYIVLSGVAGAKKVGISFSAPGKPDTPEKQLDADVPEHSTVHAFKFKLVQFPLNGLGRYALNFRLDGWQHSFVFTVTGRPVT